jgi:ubiquinone biosynthesis protein
VPLKLRKEEYGRLLEILVKSARHGFGFVIAEIGLERYLPRTYRKIEFLISSRRELPQRFRELLEDLGPTFVKIGQILSVRPDILPLEYIEELEKLQDKVPPFPFEDVRKLFESELGKSLDEVFSEFEEEPVASASISQVHRALLKDGKRVAVKIQRPEAAKIIESDLRLMRFVAETAQKRIETIDLGGIWEELATSLRNELDFVVEAKNIEDFRRCFEDDPVICIPEVIWELTSSRVLTMEFIEGVPLSDIQKIRVEYSEVDVEGLAVYGARAFMRQVLEFGIFHADLHPANLIITPDGRIAYIDFGMVGRLSQDTRKAIARMLYAQIMKDVDEIIFQAEKLGAKIPRGKIPVLRSELRDVLDRYYERTLGEIRIDIIGKEFVQLLHKNKIRIPRDYALLVKALITVEGVAHTLYPQINVLEVAKPYVTELVRKYYPPSSLIKELSGLLLEDLYVLLRMPRKIDTILTVMEGSEETRIEQIEAVRELTKTVKETGLLLALAFISSFAAVGLAVVSLALQSGRLSTFLISALFFLGVGALLFVIVLRLFLRR